MTQRRVKESIIQPALPFQNIDGRKYSTLNHSVI